MSKAVITKVKEVLKERLPKFLNLNIRKGQKVAGREIKIIPPRDRDEYSKFYIGTTGLIKDLLDICNLGAKCHSPSGIVTYDVHKEAGRPVMKKEIKEKVVAAMSIIPRPGEGNEDWHKRMVESNMDASTILEYITYLPEEVQKTIESYISPEDSFLTIPSGVDLEEAMEAAKEIPTTVAQVEVEENRQKLHKDQSYLDFLEEKVEESSVSLTQMATYRCYACAHVFSTGEEDNEEEAVCPECGAQGVEKVI